MRKPLFVLGALLPALLAACFWISGCGQEKASAEDLLAETGQKYMAEDSYRTRIDATIEVSGDASSFDPDFDALLPMKLGFGGQMDFDASDRDSIKARVYDLSVDGLTDMIRRAGEASGESDMGAIMAAGMYSQMLSGMEVLAIKDTIYLHMGGAWFDFKLSDLPASDGADFSKVDLNCLVAASLENQSTWDAEGGLTDIQELDEEEIDGVKTRHLRASIDPEAILRQQDENTAAQDECGFGDLAQSTRDDAYEDGHEEDYKALIESISETAKFDFWIDEDNNLRQQRFDMEFDFYEIGRILDEEDNPEGLKGVIMNISMTMKMSGYGEAMDITAPEDTTSMKGLFDEMSDPGMGFGGSRSEQA
ncbi:MAG: hypothetical protein HZB44_08945 [Actinobacteria bacterium]|nr:hypothetical protein [Actinomycetota bacterium]